MSKAKHRLYPEVESDYIHFEIQGKYQFRNTHEIRSVLGFKVEDIKGFKELSEEKQALVVAGAIKICNCYGLEWRDTLWPIELKDQPKEKRIIFSLTSGRNDIENSYILHYDGRID
jgi:hypothetical protein